MFQLFTLLELPKSNVMNIELHSPQVTLQRPKTIRVIRSPPIATPRNITAGKHTIQTKQV